MCGELRCCGGSGDGFCRGLPEWETPMLLTEILDEVPDPRGYNAVHDLTGVLFVALAAVLCGAVHCTEMAFFAKTRLELLRQFVPLGRGAPSHDTFHGCWARWTHRPSRRPLGGSWRRSASRPGPTPAARWRWTARAFA